MSKPADAELEEVAESEEEEEESLGLARFFLKTIASTPATITTSTPSPIKAIGTPTAGAASGDAGGAMGGGIDGEPGGLGDDDCAGGGSSGGSIGRRIGCGPGTGDAAMWGTLHSGRV